MNRRPLDRPRPDLYIFIFLAWVFSLAYFYLRLWSLLDLARSPFSWGATLFFIVFTAVAWVYGFFNLGGGVFARVYRLQQRQTEPPIPALPAPPPAVAILYTTCHDFLVARAKFIVVQDYHSFP